MDKSKVSKKLASSFFNLILRRAILLAINFATINLILARILPVSAIGIFNIANSILGFFGYFSDIGLAAALIQKKEITREDLSTTFTIQEILAFLIAVIVFIGAPSFARFYNLDLHSINLIRALAVSFFLTSLKVIPSILLERELRFGPLVITEVFESLIFNASLIYLSFNNLGIQAFTWSVLLRSVGGVLLIYIFAPWKIKLGFLKVSAKSLLNFGIPFQINSLLALLKDRLVPLVIARMIGSVGVGYITWAQNVAFIPLEVINIVTRITFPAFSRMQEDREGLKELLEESIFFTAFFFYPLSFGLVSIAQSLILHVVSSKWSPALPLIYLFSVAAFMSSFSTPFTNFLNAIGKIKITLKLMVMWTTLEWLLSPLLTYFYNYSGVAIAAVLISITAIIPFIIIRKEMKINIIKNVWQPLLASLIMMSVIFFVSKMLVFNFLSLLIVVLLGGAIYLLVIFLLAWKRLNLLKNFIHG